MLSLLKDIILKICSLWKNYHLSTLSYVSVIARKISWKLQSKLLVVMEVFKNKCFLLCHLLINITYFYAKMQDNFFVAHFGNFELFNCLLPLWQVVIWKHAFISNMHTYKNILVHLKKICHLGTTLYCLWNILQKKFELWSTISLDVW